MKDIDIEGIVHFSSKERWALLLGGIFLIPTGVGIAYFIFTLIPLWVVIPHMLALAIALIGLHQGIGFILLASIPNKLVNWGWL